MTITSDFLKEDVDFVIEEETNPGEGETITVVVTVTNNQFYFNGQPQTEYELVKGNTYIFEQSVGTNGHVLGISAVSGGISVGGLTYSYTPAGGASTIVSTSTYATYLTNPAYVSFVVLYLQERSPNRQIFL